MFEKLNLSLRVLCGLLLITGITPLFAEPVIDQSNVYEFMGAGSSTMLAYENSQGNQVILAQTFKAGMTGRLLRVKLGLGHNYSKEILLVRITPTKWGLPDLEVPALAWGLLTPDDVDRDTFTLESVDLSLSEFNVVEDKIYAIVLSSYTPVYHEYDWSRGTSSNGESFYPINPYYGGSGYYSYDGGENWEELSANPSRDYSFQTIVDPNEFFNPNEFAGNPNEVADPELIVR